MYVAPVGLFTNRLLGKGTLKPSLRAELEAEGVVLIEEGLVGSIRYSHFKAPGKRFHGKITPERIGLGISEQRVVAYCRSGRAKLVDSPFTSPRFEMVRPTTKRSRPATVYSPVSGSRAINRRWC